MTKEQDNSSFLPTRPICLSMNNSSIIKKNGGKFLYCENLEEIKEQFENILQENDWYESSVMLNQNFSIYLKKINLVTKSHQT
jgi:hypothetical protein